MTAALERDLDAILAMAARSNSPMLAVGAERYKRALGDRKKPKEEPKPRGPQLELWTARADGALEAWRGRLAPDATIRCDHFNAPVLPLKACLERQNARWPGGNKWGDGKVRAKKAGIHRYCSSGKCEQGKEYAASVSEGWAPKKFKFYRDDTPEQRRAMKKYIRSLPEGSSPVIDAAGEEPEVLDFEEPDLDVREFVPKRSGE